MKFESLLEFMSLKWDVSRSGNVLFTYAVPCYGESWLCDDDDDDDDIYEMFTLVEQYCLEFLKVQVN